MAFDVDVKVFVQSLGPAAAEALAEQGKVTQQEVEQQQQGRRGLRPKTYIAVDGKPVEDFSTVKPTSTIFEYWDYRVEIIRAAFDACQARAPVLTGAYRGSFYCLLDDVPLGPMQLPSAQRLMNVHRITITNNRAYSRRLEVGKTQGGSSFVKQVDPLIIQSAGKQVKQEFGSVVMVSYGFVDLDTKAAASWQEVRRRAGGGRKHRSGGKLRYPAIFIDQA